jgi:predicted Abi (CAAX) family protease
VAAVLLLKYFNPIFVPADPHFKDLRNIIVIPHLALISISVMVLMIERRVPDAGYGFVPSAREWRIGLLHFLYFIPVGLPLALLLGATHFASPKPVLQVAMTFVGTLWVVALSEDFFLFGVLQNWIREWSSSGQVAILMTAAIFGLLHLWFGGSPNFPNWKWALVAGVLGWFCGRARNQAGSIRASMVTHALVATAWRAFFA